LLRHDDVLCLRHRSAAAVAVHSPPASGDFVAMMQGGAVDPQRAVDAVAQVTHR
jgi:hypothetical protein